MATPDEITNSRDTIDSRDIQERIDYLESLEEERGEDEQGELDSLLNLKEEANTSEWDHGVSFISEDYFEDYARQFAEDIGAISRDTQWPATHIDWDSAANEFQIDYTAVDFDGVTYYYR